MKVPALSLSTKSLLLLALLLIGLSSVSQIVLAQNFCSPPVSASESSNAQGPGLGGFCVYSKLVDPVAGVAQFRVEVYEQVGWVSFGFGSGMHNSQIYVS